MESFSIGIVGFGRFGKVLHRLFRDGFDVAVSSSSFQPGDIPGVRFCSLEETVRRSSAILLAVPINRVGETASRIRPFLRPGQVVVDVCSVKEMPYREISEALQGTGVHIWPTHPMFGPDSTKGGFEGLVWVSCEETLDPTTVEPMVAYVESKGISVFRTTCEKHDRMAAATQGLTHLIGRYLDELDLSPSEIDTLGYKRLLAVRDQTCNDTWELFADLMRRNRFTKEIQASLEQAVCRVSARLKGENSAAAQSPCDPGPAASDDTEGEGA